MLSPGLAEAGNAWLGNFLARCPEETIFPANALIACGHAT